MDKLDFKVSDIFKKIKDKIKPRFRKLIFEKGKDTRTGNHVKKCINFYWSDVYEQFIVNWICSCGDVGSDHTINYKEFGMTEADAVKGMADSYTTFTKIRGR